MRKREKDIEEVDLFQSNVKNIDWIKYFEGGEKKRGEEENLKKQNIASRSARKSDVS